MKVEDIGFITFVKTFEENSLLIKVLSKNNGLISGYLTHIKKNRNHYSIGNLIQFTWFAKNTNQLGNLKIELIKSYLVHIISNKLYLHIINNINVLINNLLYERYLNESLFLYLETLINFIIESSNEINVIRQYLLFENNLLNVLGYGVLIQHSDKIENLYYISPKTGLAVSKLQGEPYKDKLFLFPRLLQNVKIDFQDIYDFFDLLDFFMKKYLNDNNLSHKYLILANLKFNILESLNI